MIAPLHLPTRHPSGSGEPGPHRDTPPPPMPHWWVWLLPVSIVFVLIAVPMMTAGGQKTQSLTYSDFAVKVSGGQIQLGRST